jgi:hypothetical protein
MAIATAGGDHSRALPMTDASANRVLLDQLLGKRIRNPQAGMFWT